MRSFALVALVVATGCTRAPVESAAPGPPLAPATCTARASSSLDGVRIEFPAPRCRFTLAEAAAGISVPYNVVVDATPSVAPTGGGSCARAGPSGLIVFEALAGHDQSYAIVDGGRCARMNPSPAPLNRGTHAAHFDWRGRNWSGPSDTGQTEGAPFPAGTYTLKLTANGERVDGATSSPFLVSAEMDIAITP